MTNYRYLTYSVGKLLDLHGELPGKSTDASEKIDRPGNFEPPVVDSV